MDAMTFLKKPVVQLDGFKLTVLSIILIVLIYMVWRKYYKR